MAALSAGHLCSSTPSALPYTYCLCYLHLDTPVLIFACMLQSDTEALKLQYNTILTQPMPFGTTHKAKIRLGSSQACRNMTYLSWCCSSYRMYIKSCFSRTDKSVTTRDALFQMGFFFINILQLLERNSRRLLMERGVTVQQGVQLETSPCINNHPFKPKLKIPLLLTCHSKAVWLPWVDGAIARISILS